MLGGDGSAIDCHLERASGGAFQTPTNDDELTRGKRSVMQFSSLLEDGEIFRQMFSVFPIDM